MSYTTEKALALLYPFVIITCIVCGITSGVAHAHWRFVLNACPETNCGCYLFGQNGYNSFEGGSMHYCNFATFGPMIPLFIGIIFGSHHVYRVCMGKTKRKTGVTTIRQRSGEKVVVTTESELTATSISPYYWMPTAIIAAIMAIYTIVYASIFTHGFEVTCKHYREALLKEIQGVGNIVPVVKSRLSCAAIFDFMDYLVESVSYERRKYGHINSAACFHSTLVCAWLGSAAWLAISVLNSLESRRTRAARI